MMGNSLQENKHAHVTVKSQAFYRMKCLETPFILNSFCDWTEKVDPNYMRLIDRLTSIMNTILLDAADKFGTMRRERVIKHPDFPMFEEAICEIQGVSLIQMNDSTKIVSTLNLFTSSPIPTGRTSPTITFIFHFQFVGMRLRHLVSTSII
jgi:hypothetical protein